MTTTVSDVHEEIATAKVGPLHWMLAAMMGALTFFDGYDTFNPAYVIHLWPAPGALRRGKPAPTRGAGFRAHGVFVIASVGAALWVGCG